MGTMSYDAIIVSGDNDFEPHVTKAWVKAMDIAAQTESRGVMAPDMTSIISPVVTGVANGEASFFIGPDGSKEWWPESDAGDRLRAEIVAELSKDCRLSIVEVRWGELGDRLVVDGREIVNVPD